MSTNNDFVSNCEETLGKWCKQISKVKIKILKNKNLNYKFFPSRNQVLTESEQIRREADDTGPYCMLDFKSIKILNLFNFKIAELAYWKQRMAKFNNLLEQIKSQRVKAVVGVLQAVKSKSLNLWKELVRKDYS